MNLELMQILYLLDESKSNKIEIPDLGLSVSIYDKLSTALLLLPVFYDDLELDMCFSKNPTNKSKVILAYKYIKHMENKNISMVIIVGKNAKKAFNIFSKKFEDLIVEDDIFTVKMLDKSIYFPINRDSSMKENLLALSALDTTVLHLSPYGMFIYSQGNVVNRFRYNFTPFAQFINNQGFMLNEYLYGELLYHVEKVDCKIKDIILNNLESVFIKSLIEVFEITDFKEEIHTYDSNKIMPKYESDFHDLVNILATLDFKNIKDYKFLFVRKYLYDKD